MEKDSPFLSVTWQRHKLPPFRKLKTGKSQKGCLQRRVRGVEAGGLGTEGSPSAVDGPGRGGLSREGGFPGNRPVGQAPT